MALVIVFNDSDNDPTIVEIGEVCRVIESSAIDDLEGHDSGFWEAVDTGTVATLYNNQGDLLTISPGMCANGQLMIDF